jgi:hypothetical protein
MLSSLPDLQKERGFPHPSRKKKLLKLKRESTHCAIAYIGKMVVLWCGALRDRESGWLCCVSKVSVGSVSA